MAENVLLETWLLLVAAVVILSLGFEAYGRIREKLDRLYPGPRKGARRIAHAAVYIIFLVLAYDAVEVRARGPSALPLLLAAYLVMLVIALFLFGDIIVATARWLGGR